LAEVEDNSTNGLEEPQLTGLGKLTVLKSSVEIGVCQSKRHIAEDGFGA
jgi:hypothetical protein